MISPIRCVFGVVLATMLLAPTPLAAQPSDRDRRDPSTLLPLEELWTTILPASPAAAPLHDDGRLYVPVRDGQILAVNVADGEVVWEAMQTVNGVPTVGGGLFYLATSNSLRALSLETGALVWQVALPARLSAPLVWNNGWLIAALESRALLAVAAETGETIWNRALGGIAHVRPALAADRMYVSLDNGGLLALSLRTGQLVWEQQLDGPPTEVLPLDDLFVGAADNHFYRLSRVDGSIQWRWRTGGDIVGRAAVDEERVYFSSLDNVVWALDRASGNQQWRQTLTARPTDGPGHAEDLLVLAGLGQTLTFHDPEDGLLYGRMRAPTEVAFPPLVVADETLGSLVIYVTGDGRLRALVRGATPPLVDASVSPIFFKKPETLGDDDDEDDDEEEEDGETGPTLVSTLLPPPTLDGSPAPTGLMSTGPAGTTGAVPTGTTGPAGTTGAVTGTTGPGGATTPGGPAVPAADPATPLPSAAPDAAAPAPVSPSAPASGSTGATPPGRTPPPSAAAPGPGQPAPAARALGGDFAIQVAAFSNHASARALAARLMDAGHPAYIVEPSVGATPALYRVRIGDYPDRAAAEAIGREVETTQDLDWYVVTLP